MKKRSIKKILLGTGITFLVLVAVLAVHIYIVTRPKAPDAKTIVMARIDLKQPITHEDANQITTWLYAQKGIDHVMCSAAMDNVVFTFHPAVVNGNDIASNFAASTKYKTAVRYIPTEKEMQSGCPVAATSYTYKVYRFFRHNL
jgi:hypothetical protein